MCTRIYHWHYLSPLVPSVLSRVGAGMGPTFWKLQKCAAFRLLRRYQLHFALVVALSFCFENGAPAEKWKMGVFGRGRRYQRHAHADAEAVQARVQVEQPVEPIARCATTSCYRQSLAHLPSPTLCAPVVVFGRLQPLSPRNCRPSGLVPPARFQVLAAACAHNPRAPRPHEPAPLPARRSGVGDGAVRRQTPPRRARAPHARAARPSPAFQAARRSLRHAVRRISLVPPPAASKLAHARWAIAGDARLAADPPRPGNRSPKAAAAARTCCFCMPHSAPPCACAMRSSPAHASARDDRPPSSGGANQLYPPEPATAHSTRRGPRDARAPL